MLELKIGLTGSYNNSNGGIVELLIPTFFQEKLPIRGQKLFYVKKIMGRLFWIGGLMIRSCEGLGGVS